MELQTFYVNKTTDTFADVLLAYGVAALAEKIVKASGENMNIRLRDAGDSYVISLEEVINVELDRIEYFQGLPFIKTRKKIPPADWIGTEIDYDAEKQRRDEWKKARKQLPPEAFRTGATVDEFPALLEVDRLKPRGDWQIVSQINQMSALFGYTDGLMAWASCRECFGDLLHIIVTLFGSPANDFDQALKDWKKLKKEKGLSGGKDKLTAVSVNNPGSGKGVNRLKMDSATLLNTPVNFWLVEFLKFWGMRDAGLPRIVSPPKSAANPAYDRKTYVLLPVNLTLHTNHTIYSEFNDRLWASTPVKMDIMASLRFTQIFLQQWLGGQIDERDARWGEQPGDYVAGLAMAFYKDMNAKVVLNQSVINLPRWLAEMPDEATAQVFLDVVREHQGLIAALDEDRAEAHTLLNSYRDFLSGGDWDAFFDFCAGNGSYAMSLLNKRDARERKRARVPSIENLGRLFQMVQEQKKEFHEIFQNEGFQNIAAAIRNSTFMPQWNKAKGRDVPYQPEYGLGQELRRVGRFPDKFLAALGGFVQRYQSDTLRYMERKGKQTPGGIGEPKRPTVSQEDLADIAQLVDGYGSTVVCNMLVAAGYSWPKRKEAKTADSTDAFADSES